MTLAGAHCQNKRNRGGPQRKGVGKGKKVWAGKGAGPGSYRHPPREKETRDIRLLRLGGGALTLALPFRSLEARRAKSLERHRCEHLPLRGSGCCTHRGWRNEGACAARVLPPGARLTSPEGRRGRSLRVRRRAKPGGVSRRVNHLRKAHGVFGGESLVLVLNLDFLSFFFHPCLWRIWGVVSANIYILSCVLHLLPMDNSSYGKVITYGKVKGPWKVHIWHQGQTAPRLAPASSALRRCTLFGAAQSRSCFLRTSAHGASGLSNVPSCFLLSVDQVRTIWLTQMLEHWSQGEKKPSVEFTPGWTSQLLWSDVLRPPRSRGWQSQLSAAQQPVKCLR